MRIIGIVIIIGLVLAIIAAVAVGGGLLVLLAYGVGLVVNMVLPFDSFQVTTLSLVGIIVVGWAAGHILFTYILSYDPAAVSDYDPDEEEDETEEYEVRPYFPSMPRLNPVLKHVDFSAAQPDDRCPCGSGRKYKNCHGSKRRAVK